MASLYTPEEPKIVIGAWYHIRRQNDKGHSWLVRMRAVQKNRRFVVFEDERGVRECWTYWELARCMI